VSAATRPLLLDLFCCAGGAATGYHRAGFDVVGVDIAPQPRYPFAFIQADAIDYLRGADLSGFSAIHASPPCQRWAAGFIRNRERHPDLIAATRELLQASGLPYIIENVLAAPLVDAVRICGGGLGCVSGDFQLHRHRRFESNVPLLGIPCTRQRRRAVTVVGNGTPSGNRFADLPDPTLAEKREAMGISWTNRAELSEAIPPAYTEHLGVQLLEWVA
jgi:DNA (cytosine-5)-methyltransferase 1